MPTHASLTGTELHEDKLISTATGSDAGKVSTPSATPGVGELRNLTILEVFHALTTAEAGQVVVVSSSSNGRFVVRQLALTDLATATKAQFDAACSDGNFLYTGSTTSVIAEGSNLYYTESRAKADVAEKVAALTAEANPDASDLATSLTLVNSLKAKYNALLAALAA